MNIGKQIKGLRKSAGLSLQQLADRAGLSKTYIWQIENEKHKISLESSIKIATALGMTMDELLTSKTAPSKPVMMALDILSYVNGQMMENNPFDGDK